MSDDFKKTEQSGDVLSDGAKWWEFLDPQTNQIRSDLPTATRVSSDMLDWTALRETERHHAVGFGFYNRCNTCGKPAPPDFTFCVHCGGTPISAQSIKRYSVVIKELRDDAAKAEVADIITTCSSEVNLGEVTAMLDELPAVFNVDARRDRVVTIVARLGELGAASRSFPVEDITTLMLKETFESILRDPKQLVMFAVLLATTAALGWVWGPLVLLGLGFAAWRFVERRKWYDSRYRLDDTRLLNIFCGFDDATAKLAAEVLQRTRDAEIRGSFTKCLMEYYTLHQLMRQHGDHYEGVLSTTAEILRDLIEQIVETMTRFDALQRALEGHEPARLRSRIADVNQRRAQTNDPRTLQFLDQELEHLSAQIRQLEAMGRAREAFANRMSAMAHSLEALRRRLSNVSAMRQSLDVPMDEVLRELDNELNVFEQTFAELEPAVYVS